MHFKDKNVVVMTGAGVSTSAGIPDFKSTDEDWPFKWPRAEMMTPQFLHAEPVAFWNMYRQVFGSVTTQQYEPTPFHKWVAELEKENNVVVVTQNVDGLHQKAGSSRVVEIHGTASQYIDVEASMRSYVEVTFPASGFPQDQKDYVPTSVLTGNVLKPNVVLFNEGLRDFDVARAVTQKADVFIVAGTRLMVGPANQLPYVAMYSARSPKTYYINEHPVDDYNFSRTFLMKSDEFAENVESL